MRWLTAALLFAMAFLAGAGAFLATRPAPVLRALVMELQGPGLFQRCREAGACAQLNRPAAATPSARNGACGHG